VKKIFTILVALIAFYNSSIAQCNQELWKHVYHPNRLVIYKKCVIVTGVIFAVKKEKDGDYHIQLKLDKGQPRFLNTKNMTVQKGCLVIEPICIKTPTQADAIQPCKNCPTIQIPKKGDHVKVTGSFVRDSEGNHGWNEIHPVSAIEIL